MKKGPGSHNRITSKSIEHYKNSINIMKECRCILHRRTIKVSPNNKKRPLIIGEIIEQTNFNINQEWCSLGKTTIDSLKHKFWRLTYIISMELLTDKNMTIYHRLMDIQDDKLFYFQNKFKEILNSEYIINIDKNVNINNFFSLINHLKDFFTLKNLGFYNIYFNSYDEAVSFYDNIINILEEITNVEKLNIIGEIIEELLESCDNEYFVPESSKENVYFNIKNVSYNWSKMNKLYFFSEDKYIFSGLYGPYHNTKAKSVNETCRLKKYLTEVNKKDGAKAVSKLLKEKNNKGQHADHIFPLSLGGQHSVENIDFISASENLKKKANLTYKSYLKLISDIKLLNSMINKDILPLVLDFYDIVGQDENLFNQNVSYLEKKLKNKMLERINNFINMDNQKRLEFLSKIRPDLSSNQKNNFLESFLKRRNIFNDN